MEKAKYAPEEIERMIDEEISRIEAANSMASAPSMPDQKSKTFSPLRKLLDFMWAICQS